jgi:hypothetical protein
MINKILLQVGIEKSAKLFKIDDHRTQNLHPQLSIEFHHFRVCELMEEEHDAKMN